MATTLSPIGALASAMSGSSPTLVPLSTTTGMTALSSSTNVQFNFANNGALVVAVYNSAASGGATFSFTVQLQILGLSLASTAMECITPSSIGVWLFGPFGPSKFNDSNGLCWVTQVTASAATSYIGVYSVPGALS